MTELFLDRDREFDFLVKTIQSGASVILHGESGIGKTELLRRVEAFFDQEETATHILYVSPTRTLNDAVKGLALHIVKAVRPSKEMECVRKKFGKSDDDSVRRWIEHSTGALCRGMVLRAFREDRFAILWDDVGFLSQTFCEFVKRLMREFKVPQVFAGQSAHMESVGYISKVLCGPGERLALPVLDDRNTRLLIEHCMKANALRPARVNDFVEQLWELSGGIPGRIVKMCRMAALDKYRCGREIKLRLIHIDSQLNDWVCSNKRNRRRAPSEEDALL